MTKDLEETLATLGPEYHGVVARLRDAYAPIRHVEECERQKFVRRHYLLVAALFLVFIGFGSVLFLNNAPAASPLQPCAYTYAYEGNDAALTAIMDSQRNDGSWMNDFLTQQNAAALRCATDLRGRIAYKKAVRYLRLRGLRPLTENELKARGNRAERVLAPQV